MHGLYLSTFSDSYSCLTLTNTSSLILSALSIPEYLWHAIDSFDTSDLVGSTLFSNQCLTFEISSYVF